MAREYSRALELTVRAVKAAQIAKRLYEAEARKLVRGEAGAQSEAKVRALKEQCDSLDLAAEMSKTAIGAAPKPVPTAWQHSQSKSLGSAQLAP